MKTWIISRWGGLRTNFWFVPSAMVAGAVALSLAAIHPDRATAGERELDRDPGLDVQPGARRIAGGALHDRRVDDDDHQRGVLDHRRRPATGVVAVRPAVAPQLHARSDQPGRARHVHRNLHLLPAGPPYRERHGGPEIRPERLLAGAGAGGLAGGLIRALVGWGMPRDRAKTYEAGIQQGGAVLGVKPRSDEDADYLQNEWKRHSGEHVYR